MKYSVFVCLIFVFARMNFAQNNQDFALYLLPAIKAENLSKLDLKKIKPKGAPFLTTDGISSYNKDTHELILHYAENARLKKLKIPDGGLSFIAFAGGAPIFKGAFWKGFSLPTFKGAAIDVSNLEGDHPVLKLELDYPPLAPKNPAADPRNDERFLRALKNFSRLREDVWLYGKCRAIRATGKRRPSYVFTFDVERVVKSTFDAPQITFEIFDDGEKSLREAVEAQPFSANYVEKNWSVDREKEILLKFERIVSDKNPQIYLRDFEIARN